MLRTLLCSQTNNKGQPMYHIHNHYGAVLYSSPCYITCLDMLSSLTKAGYTGLSINQTTRRPYR